MSTVHSTSGASHASQPVGFNEQSPYDPFFPSSPSEEHLVPITGEHHSSQQSYHSPSPPHNDGSGHLGVNFHSADQPQQASQSTGGQSYHSSTAANAHTDLDGGQTSYGFLSPNAYISDHGYSASSEHTATPEAGDGFYLENDFGILENGNTDQDLPMTNSNAFEDSRQPITQGNFDIASDLYEGHRASVGTVNMSAHLMSPSLTDTNGTTSRQGTASPTMANAYIKPEASHFAPFAMNEVAPAGSTSNPSSSGRPHQPQMQQTPTATNTSKGSSPDLAPTIPSIIRAPSPMVRVEKYTRGDSPARQGGLIGAKRGRAGSSASHLAVQDGGSSSDDDDEEVDPIDTTGGPRHGLDPEARFKVTAVDMPNFKDQEDATELAIKKADVEDWLDRSAPGKADDPGAPPQRPSVSRRQRARSTGAVRLSRENVESLDYAPPDAHIPGPGILIDEDSGEDDSEWDYEGPASIDGDPIPFGGEPVNEVPGEALPGVYDELPRQPELYRAKVWQDPLYDSSDPGVRMQPVTSNDAIMRFKQRARDIETISRVATWGTRRMSDSDLHSLFHRFSISEDARDSEKVGKRDRSGSFLQTGLAKIKARRDTIKGNMKRQDSESSKKDQMTVRPTVLDHGRKDSDGSGNLGIPQLPQTALKRMSSLGKRPKSPRLNTTSAVAAMSSQMAAVASSGSMSATGASSPTSAWNNAKNLAKGSKNRTDSTSSKLPNGLGLHAPGSSSETELGIASLLRKQGGPPIAALAAPLKTEDVPNAGLGDDDDDEDDTGDEHGVKMDLSIRSEPIVPTLEGFKSHVRQLNPRLPPYMFDRIAQEQLRRFKKLMDFKVKHAQFLQAHKCPSGKFCTKLGGEPVYLPVKANGKEQDMSHAGFSVAGLGPSDDEVNALAEGIVTPAQFPDGVPMPPVKRLPAEFECSLCFKVKKFNKPSDWSKHVHEDVQPFTCTFAACAEPKSFKRKADWVRHENERHRQLEWWMCNMNECSHKCYRKDNFVQHLVREHKLPEPKVKTLKVGKPAVRGPSSQKARNARLSEDNGDDTHDEIDQVWRLVDECRRETPKSPKEEPCKFCGNVCNSWKKLTVHLAKHMEQISMPVLNVVDRTEVTPETIISPIEQRLAQQQNSIFPPMQSPYSQASYGQTVPTLAEVPGGFASFHPGAAYFNGSVQQPAPHYRVSPNTYPPPNQPQQLTVGYNNSRNGSPYPISDHATTSYANSPTPSYHNANGIQQTYMNQTDTSPEIMYNASNVGPPVSLAQTASTYDGGGQFKYVGTPPQHAQAQQGMQTYVTSPIEGTMHQFGSNGSPDPYLQARQQQAQSVGQISTPPSTYPPQTMMTAEMNAGMGVGPGMGMAYPSHDSHVPNQQQMQMNGTLGTENSIYMQNGTLGSQQGGFGYQSQ